MTDRPTQRPSPIQKLLVVGLGGIGQRHARLARHRLPGLVLGALRRQAAPVPTDLGEVQCFTSIEEALGFKPQAAVIANPASQHLDIAIPLARAGVDLLIEKPLSASPNGVRELMEACTCRNTVLMVGYNLRFLATLQRFRDLIGAGRVGRILSVRAEVGQYLPDWRPQVDYRTSVSAKAALGGGVLLELSHELDYLRWIFGEIAWVSATQLRQSALEIDVEDTAHLTLGFAPHNGGPPLVATLNMDFVRHDTARQCIAIGDRGSLRWDAIGGTVSVFERGGTDWVVLFSELPRRDDSMVAEWDHFLECISTRARPLVTAADGLAIVELIAAVRRSAMERAVVHLSSESKS